MSIVWSLYKLLGAQVKRIKLFTLAVDFLLESLANCLLVYKLLVQELEVVLNLSDLLFALFCIICVLLCDVVEPERRRADLI